MKENYFCFILLVGFLLVIFYLLLHSCTPLLQQNDSHISNQSCSSSLQHKTTIMKAFKVIYSSLLLIMTRATVPAKPSSSEKADTWLKSKGLNNFGDAEGKRKISTIMTLIKSDKY